MFEQPELDRLAPRARKTTADARPSSSNRGELAGDNGNGNGNGRKKADATHAALDAIAVTEAIGFDWLSRGGKRFRPFITLASYDALKGGAGTLVDPNSDALELPDSVRRAAMAIEMFHKASLVHDDIEDDDTYRYGRETLHRKHGVPTAINVGDYLIGLGYRLVSRGRGDVGGDATADVLDRLADAHLKLSEGQGAELAWRDGDQQGLTPLDTLKIYALKTSPAFEAALYAGLRLAGPTDDYNEMITQFSRHLGVAFQIINDLKDWDGDDNNKLIAGQDALSARPTLLLALALEGLDAGRCDELVALIRSQNRSDATVRRIRELFYAAAVFDKAEKLVEKYRDRAEAIADEVEPPALRELLYFLADTVLDRDSGAAQPGMPEPALRLPIVQGVE
jgi:geranylgeranyl pyrophosphate synthase